MAGDSNTGGGGSVHWTVNTPNGGLTGRDPDGQKDTDFTVIIRVRPGMSAAQFAARLRQVITPDGDHVYFNLPIEDRGEDPPQPQIQVVWGASNGKHRGNGGKPTQF